MLIPVLAFVVVLALIVGPYWFLVLRPEQQDTEAVRKRLKKAAPKPKTVGGAIAKAQERLSTVQGLDRLLSQSPGFSVPIQRLITRADAGLTVGSVVLATVLLLMVGLLAGLLIVGSAIVGLVLGAMLAWAPILYLRWKADKRLAVFEEQFPEAVDLLARSLRAGHALPSALQMVADEIPDPVGKEFRTLFDQQNYGMTLPESLRAFAERLPLVDARFFVTAVLTQRETGGNLSAILDSLAAVIRERFKVKRQVRAVSAHGRITGWVLGAMPVVIGTILVLLSPEQMRVLVDDIIGLYMLGTGAVLQVIGVLVIRRIVDVEY